MRIIRNTSTMGTPISSNLSDALCDQECAINCVTVTSGSSTGFPLRRGLQLSVVKYTILDSEYSFSCVLFTDKII